MKESTKLKLSKETLRCLDDDDLTDVAGGLSTLCAISNVCANSAVCNSAVCVSAVCISIACG